VRLTDTRKGWPGLRMIMKYAVRVGGAHNHIFSLANCILVKDNHIKIAGSITNAIKILRASAQHTFKIEVECETLEMVEEALACGVDIIMFDNMDLDDILNHAEDHETLASGGAGSTSMGGEAFLSQFAIQKTDNTISHHGCDSATASAVVAISRAIPFFISLSPICARWSNAIVDGEFGGTVVALQGNAGRRAPYASQSRIKASAAGAACT